MGGGRWLAALGRSHRLQREGKLSHLGSVVGNDKRPQDIPSGEGAKPFCNGDGGITGPRGRGHPSPGI